MSACKVVRIKEKAPLYKGKELAECIEMVTLSTYSHKVVIKKGLVEVGDMAIFIPPGMYIPNNKVFKSFYKPNGDESKCKLGKDGKVGIADFNVYTKDGERVYSEGIIMPISDWLWDRLDKAYNLNSCSSLDAFNYFGRGLAEDLGIKSDLWCDMKGNVVDDCTYYAYNNFAFQQAHLYYPARITGRILPKGLMIAFRYSLDKGTIDAPHVMPTFMIPPVKQSWLDKLLKKPAATLNQATRNLLESYVPRVQELLANYMDIMWRDGDMICVLTKEGKLHFINVDLHIWDTTLIERFNAELGEAGIERCEEVFNRRFRYPKEVTRRCSKILKNDKDIQGLVLDFERYDTFTFERGKNNINI